MTDWDNELPPEAWEGAEGDDEGYFGEMGPGGESDGDQPDDLLDAAAVVGFDDPRAELRALVRAAAALIEQHRDGGTVGFPKRPRPTAPARPPHDAHQHPHQPEPAPRAVVPADPSFREAPRAPGGYEPVAARNAPQAPVSRWQEAPAEVPRPSFELPDHAHATPARPPSRPRPPAFEPVPPEQRAARLAVIQQRVEGCTSCVLHETRTKTVFSRGNPLAELCFVGEGPGADEDASGLPFVGVAGQLLDRMIVAMGYQPDDVYVCNIVKCRPPKNRKPTPDEMASCVGYVQEQLRVISPKVIVALGATAMEGLFGSGQGGITRLRGQWKLYQAKIPVMPTFHPAYLLRQPSEKAKVWADLQQVVQRLGRPLPKRGA